MDVTASKGADTPENFEVVPTKAIRKIQHGAKSIAVAKYSPQAVLIPDSDYVREIVDENEALSSLNALKVIETNGADAPDLSKIIDFNGLPLDKLTTYIFNCIFASDFAQSFLKPYSEGDDLATLELNLYKEPTTFKATFESLYNLVNIREAELLEKFTFKSQYFQRCESFRDFLRRLKSKLTRYVIKSFNLRL